MEKPIANNFQVEKYRHDLEVIHNTAKQIIKDFELFGIEISFSGNEQTAYSELKEQLIPVLSKLYKNKPSVFNSLLYRIDVSEKKLNAILNNFSADERSGQLANLIIEREFMKVLTKKFFS